MSRFMLVNGKDMEKSKPGEYSEPIEDLKKRDESMILLRKGGWLMCYKIDSTGSWISCGHLKLFFESTAGERYDTKVYPWTVTRFFPDKTPIIVIRHFEGLRFYKMKDDKMLLVAEDISFNVDSTGRKVFFGQFYAPHLNALGVMVSNLNGKIKFYGVIEANLEPESVEGSTEIVQSVTSELEVEVDPADGWGEAGSEIYMANLDNDKIQSSILLRTSEEIKVYKFDRKSKLQKKLTLQLRKSNQRSAEERLFFGNITSGAWQDIIQLDESGLTLYQYQESLDSYRSVSVHNDFSTARGWTSQHWDTVRIFDIDGDGISEIVSTGPAGLTILQYQKPIFVNVLANSFETSSIVGVVNSSVFLQGPRNTFRVAELQVSQDPPKTTTLKPKPEPSTLLPINTVAPTSSFRKPLATDRRWLEQWNPSQLFKDAVDMASGQVDLSVPIVSLMDVSSWNLQYYASYSSQRPQSAFLGQGWSITLAQDFIFLDKRQSIFFADFKWYLFSNGNPNELESTKIEGDLQHFNFANDSGNEITVVYNAKKNVWVVEGEQEKMVYGAADFDGASDAIQWSLEWPNWSFDATDVSKSRPVATSWYLNRRFDKARQIALLYFYDEKKAFLQGSAYTSEMLLSSIEEQNGIQVVFSYAEKTTGEFKEPKLIDKEGNIHLPTPLTNEYFLETCTVRARHVKQNFKFEYIVVEGKTRLLNSIKQELASGQRETVLELDYKKQLGNHVIHSLKSGGLTFKYDFEEKTSMSPSAYHNNEIKYLTRDVPRLAIGPDYCVLAYKSFDTDPQKNAVALKILNRQMTLSQVTLYASNLTATFQDFVLEAYKDKIVVIAATKYQKFLLTFLKLENKWSEIPSRQVLSSDSQLQLTEETIAVTAPKSSQLVLYQWDNKTKNWIPTSVEFGHSITKFAPSSRFFVVSDDTNLYVVYSIKEKSWVKQVLCDDPFKISKNTINKFDVNDKINQQLMTSVQQYSFFVTGNLITTTSFEEVDGQFRLTHGFYLLDDNFQVVKTQKLRTVRDQVYQVSKTTENNGSTFELGYFKDGSSIKIEIVDVWGKILQKIETTEAKRKLLKALNDDKNFENDRKNLFLLDWEKYTVHMSYQGLRCGRDDVLYKFTGDSWIATKKTSSTSFPLGSKHVFEVSPHPDAEGFRTAKLFEQTSEGGAGNLQVTVQFKGDLVNRFPTYLAFQKTNKTIELLLFDSNGELEKTHLFHDEIVLGSSDHQNLITYRNNTSTDQLGAYECVVRPTSTLSSKSQIFVTNVSVTDGTVERRTGYKRFFGINYADKTYTETATLIPGGDDSISGRYEASRILHVPTGNVTTSEKWFDASGEPVLPPIQNTKKDDEQPSKEEIQEYRNKFQLMDSSNSVMIALTTPFDLANNVVSYYGFERYEVNRIFGDFKSNKTWTMTNAEIFRDSRALTGDSFLRLQPTRTANAKIGATFVPKQLSTNFAFSAWMRRTDGALIVGQLQDALKVHLWTPQGDHIVNLYGSVKRRHGDWAFVELLLYSDTIHNIYHNFIQYKNETEAGTKFKKTLQFVAEIETSAGTSIDVDHIKLTPFPLDMDINVYDENRKSIAVIKPDGSIKRTVYNRNLQDMATIDEYGQVVQLSVGSNSGNLGDIQTPFDANSYSSSITLRPETGHLEEWTNNCFKSNWLLNSSAGWTTSKTHLRHIANSVDTLLAAPNLFSSESAALRFYVHLEDPNSTISLIWSNEQKLKMSRQQASADLAGPNGSHIPRLPSSGEILIFSEKNSLWLWFDGVLLIDSETLGITEQDPWSKFRFQVQGQVTLEDLFVLNKPQLTIEYSNNFGDKLQTLKYQDPQNVLVSEVLFDELGRDAITTKTTRVRRETSKPLLAFHQGFVTNKSPHSQSSVWKTGKLAGLASDLNEKDNGAPYIRTCFAQNPLNQEAEIGLPGRMYTIGSRHSTKINFDSDVAFIRLLFPPKKGFQHTTELAPSGTKKITVFDNRGLQVASYSKTPGYDHLLSTNEYDDQGRLVKILPPLYHDFVNTTKRPNPKSYRIGEAHLTNEELKWQNLLATWYSYDEYDRLTKKVTSDTGVTEFLYDNAGQQRLMILSTALDAQPEHVVFFDYDHQNQLVATGTLHSPKPSDQLKNITASTSHWAKSPNHLFQLFDYSDDHADPTSRGKVKHCVTKDGSTVVADTFAFDSNEMLVKKTTTLDAFTDELVNLSTFQRKYKHNLIQSITYPFKVENTTLEIYYSYNRLGQLVGLGTETESTKYMAFAYLPTGQLAEERFWPGTSSLDLTREYSYNSPGFLEKITDKFMTQDIAYEHGGYAQQGFGGGLAMKTTFNASWTHSADERWFRIQQQDIGGDFAQSCHKALMARGYLSGSGEPVKEYNKNGIDDMPVVCTGETGYRISTLMAQKRRPTIYGHQYAYGSYQELIKAKYFTEATKHFAQPLRPTTFASDLGVSEMESELIWKSLKASNHILSDQRLHDPKTAIGGRGIPLMDRFKLFDDLKKLDIYYAPFFLVIEKYLLNNVAGRQAYNATDFEEKFMLWDKVLPTSPMPIKSVARGRAKKLAGMLRTKDYFPTKASGFINSLAPALVKGLESFTSKIPEIIKVLNTKFNLALGESPFDFKSFKIDANGNHRLFYSGFNHHKLEYQEGRNQIEKLHHGTGFPFEKSQDFSEISKIIYTVLKPSEYSITHDTRGNIVKALHKGISKIAYHPVSQRPMDILKTDGTRLVFMYDAAGERISKRVFGPNGSLSLAKFYLRDETGQVVVDHEVHYPENSSPIVLTSAYLYGPRGLLGFWRNNNFYSVFTDHVGSIRLVIHKSRVVASYDYFPYGDLMRSFGSSDPEVDISYRFTGQEWDSETGLYNFHARLYDPSLGRFFQPDPKSQYFSPYIYGGNSPLAGVDPDGEFFMELASFIGAVVGAYLGGVAANKTWNPFEWKLDQKTLFGVLSGALVGALLPLGFAASVQAIAGISVVANLGGTAALGVAIGATTVLGAGGAYLNAATTFGWNPADWKWDDGSLYYQLFTGFATGSGLAGGFGQVHDYAGKIALQFGHNARIAFLAVSYVTGGTIAYVNAVAANGGKWDFSQWNIDDPKTWNALLNGLDSGIGLPKNFFQMGKGARKIFKTTENHWISNVVLKSTNLAKVEKLLQVLKNAKHPAAKTAAALVMGYHMGASANGDYDITKWTNDWSTYQNVLRGIFFGKEFANKLAYAKRAIVKPPPKNEVEVQLNSFIKSSAKVLKSVVGNAQKSRANRIQENLMASLFAASAVQRTAVLQHLPESVQQEAEEFFKGGKISFELGFTKLPAELQTHMNALAQTEAAKTELLGNVDVHHSIRDRSTINVDTAALRFLSCQNRRRRKRAVQNCISQQTDFSTNFELDFSETAKWSQDFNDDPAGFMFQHAVSSSYIASSLDKPRSRMGLSQVEAGIHEFVIAISREESRFFFILAVDAPLSIRSEAFQAWYVPAGSFLSVPRPQYSEPRIIITDQLDGSTVYYRTGANGTLDVYHHNQNNRLSHQQLSNGSYVVFNHRHRFQLTNWQSDPIFQATLLNRVFPGFEDPQSLAVRPEDSGLRYQDAVGRMPNSSIFGFEIYTGAISTETYAGGAGEASVKANVVAYWNNGWKAVTQLHGIELEKTQQIASKSTESAAVFIYLRRDLYTMEVDPRPKLPKIDSIDDAIANVSDQNQHRRHRRSPVFDRKSAPSPANSSVNPFSWLGGITSWIPTWNASSLEGRNPKCNVSSARPSPSILEMGDSLLNSVDWFGNLTWASLLISKFTGQKPYSPSPTSTDFQSSTLTSMKAVDIVQGFLKLVDQVAQEAGLEQDVTVHIDYFHLINQVKEKLRCHQGDQIPGHLSQMLLHSLRNEYSLRPAFVVRFTSPQVLETIKQLVISKDT